MSKLGVASGAMGFTGTGAAGLYGAYSMGAFGGSGKEGDGKYNGWYRYIGEIQGDKETYVNQCLGKMFQNWKESSGSLPTIDPAFTWSNSSAETKACLVYNWKKENREKNWAGSKFHMVWTISKGEEGVAVYLTAMVKSSTELVFEGFAYVLKQHEGKWEAQQKLGLRDANNNKKTISSGEWKTRFPKLEQASFTAKAIPAFWNFLDNNGTKVSDLAENHTSNQWWEWKSVSGDTANYSLKYWSSNFSDWWDYFFDKNKLNMMQLMENTNGNWS